MAKNEKIINGIKYKVISETVGHKLNEAGNEVPIIKVFYGRTLKEARAKRDTYLERIQNNLDTKTQYFGVIADRWIYNFLALDDNLALSTRELYIRTWNYYLKPTALYSLPLNTITAGTIQNTINELHKAGASLNALQSIKKTLRRFYNYLVQNGLTPYNFTDAITLPKRKAAKEKNITVWTDDELNAIINGLDTAPKCFRLRFLIVIGIYTGLRISEAVGLKYDDIQETDAGYILKVQRQVKNITIYDTDGTKKSAIIETDLKTNASYRTIPLPATVINELSIHRKKHLKEQMQNGYRTDFIFTTDTGRFLDSKNIRTAFSRYYKTIGVPYKGYHTYRHTFGTNLYKNGVPIITASRLLGHDDISTTQKYYIATPEDDKRKAIELLASAI